MNMPLGTNFIEILIKIQNFSFKINNASEIIVCEMAAILSGGGGGEMSYMTSPEANESTFL